MKRLKFTIRWASVFLLLGALSNVPCAAQHESGLSGIAKLDLPEDIPALHVQQAIGYFQRRADQAQQQRDVSWNIEGLSTVASRRLFDSHRQNLKKMLGLESFTAIGSKKVVNLQLISEERTCQVLRIAVPINDDLTARAILFVPKQSDATRDKKMPATIVCGKADAWPEKMTGLENRKRPQWLTHLIDQGVIVCIPQSIERLEDHPYCKQTRNKNRRWILYRLGFVVGRTMPGIDVQDVLTLCDYLHSRDDVDKNKLVMAGVGQGGMTALYAAAVDPRISAVSIGDYFGHSDPLGEPIDRRLPGKLLEFGEAEVAALIATRKLSLCQSKAVDPELKRAQRYFVAAGKPNNLALKENFPQDQMFDYVTSRFNSSSQAVPSTKSTAKKEGSKVSAEVIAQHRDTHFTERVAYLRKRIDQSEAKRKHRWNLTDIAPATFPQTQTAMLMDYRKLVGQIETASTPLHPQALLAQTTEKYKLYHVQIDVTEGVQVYGHLLVPRGKNKPLATVICQHGLSGRPKMISGLNQKEDTPYHQFGRRLAERGYVVFAPLLAHQYPVTQINDQVRLANSVGMMRVALPVAKTRRVVDFLQTLPFVDPQRIGYYGLSYGGYSALWIGPLESRLAAIVPSGHFNDWRSKITNDKRATSYLQHPDEDFYDWNVLHRFTHPELITMMAPRPICIEFGKRDGITSPEWTSYSWRQTTEIFDHLNLSKQLMLATFDGPHEVDTKEAFEFLDRHLKAQRNP